MSSQRFDPRLHSMVTVTINQRNRVGSRSEEFPLRHFTVGPHVPMDGSARPTTAPGDAPAGPPRSASAGRPMSRQAGPQPPAASPRFLNSRGKWRAEELPSVVLDTLHQPLTATARLRTTTLDTSLGPRSFRPVSAVFSYADQSPVVTAEYVRELDTSTGRPTSTSAAAAAAADPLTGTQALPVVPAADAALGATASSSSRPTTAAATATAGLLPSVLKKQRGPPLSKEDIERCDDLARPVVAGTTQTRLVAGKWRYLTRPVQGDVLFTDYYGPLAGGKAQNAYYGRTYASNTAEFTRNKLVGDRDYQKVQASMMGIQGLRTRPGLTLQSTIVHAANPDKLVGLAPAEVPTSGLHALHSYARITPAAEVAWVK